MVTMWWTIVENSLNSDMMLFRGIVWQFRKYTLHMFAFIFQELDEENDRILMFVC